MKETKTMKEIQRTCKERVKYMLTLYMLNQ